jgi:hypothetical protein
MLQQALHDVFAPWVRELDLRVLSAQRGEVRWRCRWRRGMCTAAACSAARR